jgi:hypothetical protein
VPKRGESRPFRVEYRWPGTRPGVRAVESTVGRALATAEQQATIVGGTTGERDCLVRVVDRRAPQESPRWRRACPSCEEVTAWGWTAHEWRHVGSSRACSDGTNPPRADEDPFVLWTAVEVDA